MSCRSCIQLPKEAYAQFVNRIRMTKVSWTSRVRVVYIDSDVLTLHINGKTHPYEKDDTRYFDIESGDDIVLSLVNRGGKEIVSETFDFKKDQRYTLIVFEDYILQFEELKGVCPEVGMVTLQAYNMDGGDMDIYLDEDLIFDKVGKDQFVETNVEEGIYDLRISSDKSLSYELELKSGIVYTMFFLFDKSAMFIVENEYCT